MDRKLTVEFGPSRSKRFGKALAEAENGPGALRELEPGRYRASFLLGSDAAAYTALARLLERVRHWRASEVRQGEEPVSGFHAKDIEVSGCPKIDPSTPFFARAGESTATTSPVQQRSGGGVTRHGW